MLSKLALILPSLTSAKKSHPSFPSSYTAVATLELPYANINIPLTFQVDETSGVESISYYQGLEKDLYDEKGNKYKYVFENAVRKCMKNEGPHDDFPKSAKAAVHVLPTNIEDYEYAGKKVVGGQELDRYLLTEKHGSTGSMDDHLEFLYDPLLNTPVMWHMHARNRVFGSHTDEYIVKYLSFIPMPDGELSLTLPEECKEGKVQIRNKKSNPMSMPAESVFQRGNMGTSKKKLSTEALGISNTFMIFALAHNLHYGEDAAEWQRREKIFVQNKELVDDLNRKSVGKTTYKLNKFAAMEKHEIFGARLGRKSGKGKRVPTPSHHLNSLKSTCPADAPTDFDWRKAHPGAVGPVRDQGVCGSCWAFSAISAIESANFIANDGKIDPALPEQFVIDCTWNEELAACDGGLSNVGTREIIKKYGGIVPTAESYGQYLTVDGYCRAKPQVKSDNKTLTGEFAQEHLLVGAKISEYVDLPSRNEETTKCALLKQPLAIAINAMPIIFYDSGIVDDPECEKNSDDDLDHAINLVGYGTDPETGLDYWLCRNSWSSYWGDEGYFKVRRGARDCGVSTDAGFPVVEGSSKGGEGELYV